MSAYVLRCLITAFVAPANLGPVGPASALLLHSNKHRSNHRLSATRPANGTAGKSNEGYIVHVQVLDYTAFASNALGSCICPIGEFYHWRNKDCVEKGDANYECGYFPYEYQDQVCRNGLFCAKVNATPPVPYAPHKGSGGQSFPAYCTPCSDADPCEDQAETCVEEHSLYGEACVTLQVAVDLIVDETEVQDTLHEHQVSFAASKTPLKLEGNSSASDDSARRADSLATFASAPTEMNFGRATKTSCASVKDAREYYLIDDVTKLDRYLADKLVDVGRLLAFEDAFKKAEGAAIEQGLLKVQEAVEDLNSENSTESTTETHETNASEAVHHEVTTTLAATVTTTAAMSAPASVTTSTETLAEETTTSAKPTPSQTQEPLPSVSDVISKFKSAGQRATYDQGAVGQTRRAGH